jgi:hypothetical protein
VGTAGVIWKIFATTSDVPTARRLDREGADGCVESCFVGPLVNSFVAPHIGVSIGLLMGATRFTGRRTAHRDLGDRRDRTRRAKLATGLGFGLLGLGTVSFATLQVLAWRYGTTYGQGLALSESAWWSGIALGHVGAGLAGWGIGYLSADARPRHATAMVAPLVTAHSLGLGFSGHF